MQILLALVYSDQNVNAKVNITDYTTKNRFHCTIRIVITDIAVNVTAFSGNKRTIVISAQADSQAFIRHNVEQRASKLRQTSGSHQRAMQSKERST